MRCCMTHIIDVRMHGEADTSPLQMISAERLAHLQRMESLAKELLDFIADGHETVYRAFSAMTKPAAVAIRREGDTGTPPP